LEVNGYAVRSYTSAFECLQDEVIFAIYCIIADIHMPIMNGFELQRLAGIKRPQLPVILMTALPDPISLDPKAANNRGLLKKPIAALDLLRAVAEAVGVPF
jgi:FixJ family two-component response regulator